MNNIVTLPGGASSAARSPAESLAQEMSLAVQYGSLCFKSGQAPKNMTEAQVQYLCSYAMSIGIHPARATTALWIPNGGRPALYTKTCLELILARGGRIDVVELTDELCTLRGWRHDGTSLEETIRKSDFKHLTHKDTWKQYPKRMLKAMATRNLAADLFADYLSGADVAEPSEVIETEGTSETQGAQAKPLPLARLTSKLTMASAVQGLRNDPSPEGRAALVQTYVPAALPEQTLAQEPIQALPVEPAAPAKRQAAKPERIAEVLEANSKPLEHSGATLVNPSVVGEAVPWDAQDKAHRAIVTEVFNAKEIPPRWRNTHREKLTAFLSALSADNLLRATLEDVTEAVESYVIHNPPAGAKA